MGLWPLRNPQSSELLHGTNVPSPNFLKKNHNQGPPLAWSGNTLAHLPANTCSPRKGSSVPHSKGEASSHSCVSVILTWPGTKLTPQSKPSTLGRMQTEKYTSQGPADHLAFWRGS